MDNLIPSRSELKEKISEEIFDVITIGGGVTGAGVARDAALRGLSVALFEKNDFASGTSSQTSKLIHGGLRYLRNYEFGLVRTAALERKVHVNICPHLADILEFVIPQYSWNKTRKITLKAALLLYDVLSIPKRIGKHKMLTKDRVKEFLPIISDESLEYGAVYHDVRTDDSRLTLANILSAAAAGARTLNYSEVQSWEQDENDVVTVYVKDHISGEEYKVRGLTLVICGGPFADIIENRGMWFNGKTRLRLTRGTHLLMKKRLDNKACLLINEDDRPIFLIPRLDYDLIGTTDVEFTDHPDLVKPTIEDKNYILNAVNMLFPKANYNDEDVVAAFAGVRPLVFQDTEKEGEISRDHVINVEDTNILTISGGKLTTYRKMAEDAVNKIIKILNLKKGNYRCVTDKLPLWGGELENWEYFLKSKTTELVEKYSISNKVATTLVRWYGSEIEYFEEYLVRYGLDPLDINRPWLIAQVYYSCQVEHIQTPIDFLRRRTPMMLEEGNGKKVLDKVVEIMQHELTWDDNTTIRMKEITLTYIDNYIIP